MKTSIYTFTNKQKSSRVGEEKANYSARKPDSGFTPWTWSSDGRMVRYPQNGGFADYNSEQECSEESDLEEQIALVTKLRQELVDRSSGSRKKEYLQGIKSKDRDLDYLRQRLELARSSQLRESPNSQATDESQPTLRELEAEVVDTDELTPDEERSSILLDPPSVEVIDTDELTPDEERSSLHLERKVERSFYVAGKALQQLRDRKLYRSRHGSFEEYCRERFGFSRRQPYYLIEAAAVFDNLSEKCEQIVHILPTKEG